MAKTPELTTISLEQLRVHVKFCVDRIGLGPASELLDVDKPALSRFVNGKMYKEAPPKLLESLDVKRDVRYIVPKAKLDMLKKV